jgi:uncharacterized membrane protein
MAVTPPCRVSERIVERPHEKFTARLEAFSDLVFGFSLSLLATRLDVPSRVEEVFEPSRWIAIIVTFAFVCRFWLEHYRIFRHHFVAQISDAIVNFVFLFAIAILPYALQTFLRFDFFLPSFSLYVGDFSLILLSLAILRVRSLQQRRNDPDVTDRLRAWRRSLIQFGVALLMLGLLLALRLHGGSLQEGMAVFDVYVVSLFCLIVLWVRWGVQRLPGFLSA